MKWATLFLIFGLGSCLWAQNDAVVYEIPKETAAALKSAYDKKIDAEMEFSKIQSKLEKDTGHKLNFDILHGFKYAVPVPNNSFIGSTVPIYDGNGTILGQRPSFINPDITGTVCVDGTGYFIDCPDKSKSTPMTSEKSDCVALDAHGKLIPCKSDQEFTIPDVPITIVPIQFDSKINPGITYGPKLLGFICGQVYKMNQKEISNPTLQHVWNHECVEFQSDNYIKY